MEPMKRFLYAVRDPGGQVNRGELIASSWDEAAALLQETGSYVVSITQTSGKRFPLFSSSFISDDQKLFLLESWSMLLQAGFSIQSSMLRLRKAVRSRALVRVLEGIQHGLSRGLKLSEAVAASRLFPVSWVAVLTMGEQRGDIAGPLQDIRRQILTTQRIKREALQMLIMPVMLVMLTMVWFLIFLHTVVPTLVRFTAELGSPVPFVEVLSVGTETFSVVTRFGVVLLAAAILVGMRMGKSNHVMGTFQTWIPMSTPVVGPLISALHLFVVASELRIQLQSGISINSALHTLCMSVPNKEVRRELFQTYSKLQSGFPLDEAVASLAFIPIDHQLLIVAGNASGRLPEMLAILTREAEEEVRHRVQQMVVSLRTGVVFACGLMVGLLVAVFFGLWLASFSAPAVSSPSIS